MPNTKSSQKRLRQNISHRARNLSVKRDLRTQCRKVREAITDGNAELAQTEFQLATKKLDRAASRKIVHRNAVARVKSRISAKIKAIKKTAEETD